MESFWYLLGAMSGVAASLVLLPLMRDVPRRVWWIGTAAAGAALFALGVYRIYGSPEWAADGKRHALASAPHDRATSGAAGSLAEATARLAARLAGGDGGEADWQLLAQSYDALGDAAAAAEARAHRLGGAPVVGASGDARGTAAPGESASADDWADHADRLASATRSLIGEPAAAIERALARDPGHPKALWLAASLSMETRDYARAQAQWQRLLAVLPAGSPDRRLIEANLAETRALMGAPAAPAASASSAATLQGTVDVDPALRGEVHAGMTLFVFARPAPGGGPPLAAVRLQPSAWPASFRLDDSDAMLPGSSLGAHDRLFVEARLSTTGSVAPAAGDLLAEGTWVPSRDGEVALRLTRRRP